MSSAVRRAFSSISHPWARRVKDIVTWAAIVLCGVTHNLADETGREVAKKAIPCVVGIYCQKEGFTSFFGTGTVISSDGHLLTSTTVVPPGATNIEVVFADFVIRPGQIVESNESLETTLLKVDATDLPFLPLARSMPEVGNAAYTLSNANHVMRINGQSTFSQGLISGIYPVANQGGESLYAGIAIETTAAVNPGTDGGPILNESGQLCAIVSLNVSQLRWQGVGVPTKELLERLEAFKSQQVKLNHDPVVTGPSADDVTRRVSRKAVEWSQYLVGIQVQRKHPVETLPRVRWDDFVKGIDGFEKKEDADKAKILESYFESARLIESNQMLRRPGMALTGIVISPDGHILTSAFNVGEDVAFIDKATGKPPTLAFRGSVDELSKAPEGGFGGEPNPVEKVSVLLANGSNHEAKVVARHVPLGVAILKIESTALPFLDVAKMAAAPRLGASIGLVGYVGGPGTTYTLNSGIVSAPVRNRGFQFQTDALLNYGNSGGPVFDAEGQWYGIGTSPIEPQTVLGRVMRRRELNAWSAAPNSGAGMVARADRIVELLEELKSGKSTLQIPGAYLGVGPDPEKALGNDVVIGMVSPGSPAEKGGLKRGDTLVKLNGEQLRDWKDLTEHLIGFKPGDKVEVLVRRPEIVRQLMLNGRKVGTEAELQELMKTLKPGDKVEGTYIVENEKVLAVTLGERQ